LLEWSLGWADQQIAKQKAFRDGTEKRMQDVISEIVSNKDRVTSLEMELVTLKEQKEAIVEQPEEVEKVNKEIDRIDKFLENLGQNPSNRILRKNVNLRRFKKMKIFNCHRKDWPV